ncbi:MAG: hypothetical protein CL670_05030 [Balneola sp.]|jgi:hypothetical protein|nr:hypothetical protein [Balneola sp.]MBE78495.1 hypothetical protein [Balneola sp.]HBX65708.1 hypothetical protein [Balneolaceae bacterium]|tara:strand:+ start:170 stop:811 length:642 start_codon:yes stop_codon:yes gene_type:complete
MVQKLKIASLLLLGLLPLLSCSTSKELPSRTEFKFTYQDIPFEIISISAPTGEGYNYLVQLVQNESVFRSMDTNQDGYIDLVQYGEFSLEEANEIYIYGIQEAMNQQKFKARNSQRIFTFEDDTAKYTLQTFGNYKDLLYNEFTILHFETGLEEVFQDRDADGDLDTVINSERIISEVQETYHRIVEIGKEEKRIEIMYEKTVVLIKKQERPS